MHELSICQALLDQVREVARQRSAARVVSVALRIGPLAGVEPALLEQAFAVASARTLAEGAQLVIEPTAVRVECTRCGARSEVSSNALICPECGAWQTRVLEGEELLLMRVELS